MYNIWGFIIAMEKPKKILFCYAHIYEHSITRCLCYAHIYAKNFNGSKEMQGGSHSPNQITWLTKYPCLSKGNLSGLQAWIFKMVAIP